MEKATLAPTPRGKELRLSGSRRFRRRRGEGRPGGRRLEKEGRVLRKQIQAKGLF